MPRQKKEEQKQENKLYIEVFSEVLEHLKLLGEKVSLLSDKISELMKPKPELKEITSEKTTTETEHKVEITTEPVYPIPLEYRNIVDTILNNNFGIKIVPMKDLPAFHFFINVPKKYSNASESHWQMYKEDSRGKVIDYASGVNGVREWSELVFKNFNPDIQAMITADRITQQ